MSLSPQEFSIPYVPNISHDTRNAEAEILKSFFDDKKIAMSSCISSLSIEKKKESKTKLQKLKDLGLLGAIKKSDITSENYKKHIEDYFGN